MLESQRKVMLEDMGLRIFEPRFRLPGAKVSILLPSVHAVQPAAAETLPDMAAAPVPDTSAEGQLSIAVDASSAVDLPVKSDLASLFGSMPSGRGPEALQENAASPVRFRHRLVRVGELLMLLDQPTLEWVEAARCKSFFADVHFSIAGKRYEYWQDAQFDWPPVRNFPLANDRDMAHQALQAFMQEHLQPSCRWIVLWGESLAPATLGQPARAGETAFLFNLPVLVLDSCQDYWQEPQKKKLLWQHLQVVKKSLAGNA